MNQPRVMTPVPRDKWRNVLALDAEPMPEHAPEWMDALLADGRYRDVSRLYSFADGREVILPLVQRRGIVGLGGWLLSYPPGWGMGGLFGSEADSDIVRAVLSDIHNLRNQRVVIRPDPRRWAVWEGALNDKVLAIPLRAHVIELGGGPDDVWRRMSKSARRGIRAAERMGVRIECGHSGALLHDYYTLFLTSLDRWADYQHEPRMLAHARAQRRDPLAKLQAIGRNMGEKFVVTVAYIDDKPVAASITNFADTAHDTSAAMDKELVGNSGAGELVLWTNLKLACERGCTAYHLGESGDSVNLARFKEKFGAKPRNYAELRLDRLPWTQADAALRGAVKRVLGFRDV